MANPVGRPPKLTDEERTEVLDALRLYVNDTSDPTIVGFVSVNEIAIQYDVNDSNLYDWDEFSGLIKRAIKKQEHYLLTEGGQNKYNPTMAIFRLKQPQHGYTDRQDVNQSGEVKHSYEELDDDKLDAAIKARETRISKSS